MKQTFDLAVLMENLREPTAYALLAVVLGAVAAVYAVLAYWMYLTEPEDADDE